MDFNTKRLIHAGDFLIELDEAIADIIIELNKKGYKTSNCCSGHIYKDNVKNKETNCYISFYKPYNLKLPKGYSYDSDNVIRRYFSGNKFELESQLNQNIDILTRWVDKLPVYDITVEKIKDKRNEQSYIKYLNKNLETINLEIIKSVQVHIKNLNKNDLKEILKELGIKNYSKLNKTELLDKLNETIDELSCEERKNILLWIYENNKVKFGMFQKEVIAYLNISKTDFDKIRKDLNEFEIGKERFNIGGKMQSYVKYDRMKIYNIVKEI
ncbi:TPA: Rho termination factor N-terminal domain-containing protein [Clostridioides difficile]|nr:Rho termination factor N-terminal domain-containing protein [Clostridioides difficile]MCI4304771.1 Rho termination factor N-terminal domain-containing protein [Clostridioides difficile]MCM4101575.1 Rho termination factor N-terminal domain-containing protein [Clostridioides difficile]HBG2405021.1 hypothetical protein [Clostridioides difficile]HDF4164005.1 hypothetical protein [Clostridioides difficile]